MRIAAHTQTEADMAGHADEHLASALRLLIGDRNVRRYLCLHHPEDLQRAQHALDAWELEHQGAAGDRHT